MLHNEFVVGPIDKASGDVALFCQGHYTQNLINKLGLNNVNNITSTYNITSNSIKEYIILGQKLS